MSVPTQTAHPWRATLRTTLAALLAVAAMLPLIYQAATNNDPAAATGLAAAVLAIAAGITRVMALPVVTTFLQRFVPFLAPEPAPVVRSHHEGDEGDEGGFYA
ncbi:hypothetical protein [Aeromicrobium sp. Leaf291]|uniref:hypothetical protein n=1 Tax=Aeromicrobium sp. Leaf291 TaxID=1736325 RepID=UPI00191035A2|nr:hypothetical protein [Aeromicrobium sp. Leaf291]